MKLCAIKESGTNNILTWAINNGANIKSDRALQSIINDELSYLVTIEDINFFQLFRLTQIYRNQILIINEKEAELPSMHELNKLFNGVYVNHDRDIPLSELVTYCGEKFISLVMQMINDDDIISADGKIMFLPMISRKFTIQLPIEFTDFINSMNEDEANDVYNSNYPNTLQNIINFENHGVKTAIQLAIIRATTVIKYDAKYEKYIKHVKYSSLKSDNKNKLFKYGLIGFFKEDNISKNNIRVNMFNINKNTLSSNLKLLHNINESLQFEFAIQLPIEYMQILENSFSNDILSIAYESSIDNIIDSGISYENFITYEYDQNDPNGILINDRNNEISAYYNRINEANQNLINTINILSTAEKNNSIINPDIDTSSIFALLPSIYTTKAVIRFSTDNMSKLLSHPNLLIKALFREIFDVVDYIIIDINKN